MLNGHARLRGPFPPDRFDADPFQVLVHSEEVRHLMQEVLGNIRDVVIIALRDRWQARPEFSSGRPRSVMRNSRAGALDPRGPETTPLTITNIKRIAVFVERLWNKP
jgi:hypothetical protein